MPKDISVYRAKLNAINPDDPKESIPIIRECLRDIYERLECMYQNDLDQTAYIRRVEKQPGRLAK
jgi:hypothetical protein